MRENVAKFYCVITLLFISLNLFISCQRAKVVDSFPVPSPGGLAFDGSNIWINGVEEIWQLDTSGNIINYFDSPSTYSGLTCDGTYLWLIDFISAGNGMLYKLDTEMNIIDIFDISVVVFPMDLAYDGEYLWLIDFFADNIYKLDTSGNIIDVFDSPCASPTGLGFDGTHLWLSAPDGDLGLNKLYKIDMNGNVKNSFYAPGRFSTGITFDGQHLLLSAINNLQTPTIYKLNIF